MKLRNYTSSVSVDRSVSDIERLLVEGGATHIAKVYEKQMLSGITFQIYLPAQEKNMVFKLPSKAQAVERMMIAEVRRPRPGTIDKIKEQAARTAWRLLNDWVAVQVSMIKLEQAEFLEIFMPYVYDAKHNQTLFEKCKEGSFKMLEGPKS